MIDNGIAFDIVEAEELLRKMSEDCSYIQLEAGTLLGIMEQPVEWRDDQMQQFQDNLRKTVMELNDVLRLESENMNIFYERVMELRR